MLISTWRPKISGDFRIPYSNNCHPESNSAISLIPWIFCCWINITGTSSWKSQKKKSQPLKLFNAEKKNKGPILTGLATIGLTWRLRERRLDNFSSLKELLIKAYALLLYIRAKSIYYLFYMLPAISSLFPLFLYTRF